MLLSNQYLQDHPGNNYNQFTPTVPDNPTQGCHSTPNTSAKTPECKISNLTDNPNPSCQPIYSNTTTSCG